MKPRLLVLVFCLFTYAGGYAQKRMGLTQALGEVTRIYGTKFSYEEGLIRNAFVDSELVPKNRKLPVETVLKELLYPNDFLFLYVQNNYFTIIRDGRGKNNNDGDERFWKVITGNVKDSKGAPLVGVTVLPDGYAVRSGVTTSSDGSFTLRLQGPAEALIFSYVGMEPQRRVIGNNTHINVTMGAVINELDEVEVLSTGYQKISKERATGAFSFITDKDLKEVPTINILERLEGLSPGVQVDVKNNTIRIRGINSFGSTTREPLIVVDGFPMTENVDSRFKLTKQVSGQSAGGAVLSAINPEDIQNITVLKDAAAASIWGAQAANGVIVIETKRGRSTVPTINFGSNLSISAPADYKGLNRMSSAQYIDMERELKEKGFYVDNINKDSWMNFNHNLPFSEALEWMFKADRGTISVAERDVALARLSAIDNSNQIRDNLLQNATSQQYNLSLSGGTSKNTYYVSSNYSKDIPVFRGNKGTSYSFVSNLTSSLFNDNVKMLTGLSYNHGNSISNQATVNAIGGTNQGLRPYELLKDEYGNNISRNILYRDEVMQDFLSKGYLDWSYSPMNELSVTNYNGLSNNIRFNMDINTKLNSWMNFAVSGQLQRTLEETENIDELNSYSMRSLINTGTSIDPTNNKLVYGVPLGGKLQSSNYSGWQYVLRSQLNINKDFGPAQAHNLSVVGGVEMRQNQYRVIGQTYYGYNKDTYSVATINPTVPYETVQGWSSTIGGSNSFMKNITRGLSYYSNAAASFFQNKYMLSGSLRFDDMTVLGASREQRAKPLWSLGGKWNAKGEDFLKDINWINSLSLRLTYGLNGTMPSTSGAYTVITMSTDNETNEQTASISSPANTQIGWEKVRSTNLGLDFSTMSNRLSVGFDYYTKRTSDILYSLPFNATYGWSQLTFNSASMKAHGIDLGIRTEWMRRQNFGWNTVFNFSYNTNEVTDSRFKESTLVQTRIAGSTPTVGLPVGYLYAYNWAGLDKNGQSQVYNKDGEVITADKFSNAITIDDLRYMGRTTAPYFGGVLNNFTYKEFTFGFRISYELGHVMRRLSVQNYPSFDQSFGSYTGVIGSQRDLGLRWRKEGDEAITNVPGIVNDANQFNSISRYRDADILVISGSHVRLQQINLGYAFPSNFLKKTPFKSLNVNASVRNLGLLWKANKAGVDPQYLGTSNYNNLPPAKQFFFSINTSF
ncbi:MULTISPECIES: SusC/RagA family TonB-linked outer membrane protein [Sphingobacterium]|uniref:SusC/RagA family TonB-linked outer membrane protein n=1 Tax=Sphingobacterium TaxID=28453 RepID=UPI00104ADFA6|nr:MULTISPECIES: SusC/RagA family TonB-linked outer membrane protein [Sphingobacterium]MCW2263165.1 TonB-linked SusC/RagA family outer membrane protein [Sphingobacterium kitahiroshimense]TCR11851.1 TonB-linked SusC/RagA family outer membrane protein [Sphingobacterium sp. JUb78]